MDEKIKYILDDIEHVLVVHLRPSYLLAIALEETPNEINIIVSCAQFRGKSIQRRIAIVFNLLNKYISDTIAEYLVVVQALDGDEMLDYLDNCFEEIE